MAGKIDGMKPPFVPIGGLEGIPRHKPMVPKDGASDFHKMLLDKVSAEQDVTFSAHAKTRLESRKISMDAENVSKIAEALDQAKNKGAHDSLILLDNMAFIANVDSRTIITAMDDFSMEKNVFTNIDSAVILK